MTGVSRSLLLGAVLLLPAADALGDRLIGAGVFCVSAETYQTKAKVRTIGQRDPQIAFYVSDRSEIEDEKKFYAVAPLNDEVFRGLAALPKDARICLTASQMSVRHGHDLLFAWDLQACVNFDCTNVPAYDEYTQGRSLRLKREHDE